MCIFKLELDLLLYCRVSQGNHSYPTYPFVPHCVAPVSEVPRKERRRKKKKSFVFFLSSCRICERGEILICHWCHGYWHFNNVVELVDDISTTFDVMDNATTVLQSTYYHSVIIDLLIHLYYIFY